MIVIMEEGEDIYAAQLDAILRASTIIDSKGEVLKSRDWRKGTKVKVEITHADTPKPEPWEILRELATRLEEDATEDWNRAMEAREARDWNE